MIASRSISMAPMTDCSASTLWGSTRFTNASSISLRLCHLDSQLCSYVLVELNGHLKGSKAADGIR